MHLDLAGAKGWIPKQDPERCPAIHVSWALLSGGGYSMGSGSQRDSEAESLTLAGEKGGQRQPVGCSRAQGSQRQAWRPSGTSWASVLSGGRGWDMQGVAVRSRGSSGLGSGWE